MMHDPEELFLKTASTSLHPESETPPPLRINKQPSPSSSEPRQQWAQYQVPPSAAQYGAPTSPPPSGPLPYPDPERQQQRRGTPLAGASDEGNSTMASQDAAAVEEGRAPGAPGQRRTSMHSDASSGSGTAVHRRRAHFDAGDPYRPTVGGYGSSPPLTSGLRATIGRLAERRGTPTRSVVPPDSPGGPEPPHKSDDEWDEGDDEEGDSEGGPDEESGTLFSIPVMRGGKPAPTKPAGVEVTSERGGQGGGGVGGVAQSFHHYYPPPLGSTTGPAASNNATTAGGNTNQINIPNPGGVNRLASTASTSTTRASRGSPPPPETPIDPAGGPTAGLSGIEARYAASGIPGTNTLNEMQAQSAAAAARRAAYESPQPQRGATSIHPAHAQPTAGQSAAPGRWSPTERPGSAPHGPPIAFQGVEEVSSRGAEVPPQSRPRQASRTSSTASGSGRPTYPTPPQSNASGPASSRAAASNGHLESGMNQLNLHEEPPPAYSPPAPGTVHSPYPNEKGIRAGTASPSAQSVASTGSRKSTIDPNLAAHPAFANRSQQTPQQPGGPGSLYLDQQATQSVQYPMQANGGMPQTALGGHQRMMSPINVAQANQHAASPAPNAGGPASPPPLPEGWIAHLDNNSGQYYYIHLPTQSTQWEFPKGPTPLNLAEPTSPTGTLMGGATGFNPLASPTGSIFKQPLASPSFGPGATQYANYDGRASMMGSIASPTAAGFTGPPPSSGVDLYKVQPTNGVYFGPYLRYTNLDLERGLWLGSIMLITDAAQPPTIHIHQSIDLSPNPRQLKAHPIHSHQRWIFYRYDIDLRMDEHGPAKWTYAITSHLGCTRYEFLVAGRYETNWRFVAHSGNDFAINVSANERARLGGIALMWKDVLLKHQECGGFHAQLGLGGQIYADRLWKDIPALKQWTQMSGKENRRTAPWTPKLDEDVTHAYFHYYTSHFDQTAVREAFAQIPHVCCLDDHDIFDGWGSYPEYMQSSNMFKNLGRIGIEMYLLFQHHTTHEILRAVSNDIDLFTITGQGWHFVKFLGPSVVLIGPDTRAERTHAQVLAGPTYQGLFPKVATLPPSVQHCIWLIPVPIVYPRLDAVEQVAHAATTGKRVVTGGFNMLGKVAGGVAGVVGAKGMVNSGFEGVKRAVGKSGLMQNVLSPFGEVEMLDELRDLWTHESKVSSSCMPFSRRPIFPDVLRIITDG